LPSFFLPENHPFAAFFLEIPKNFVFFFVYICIIIEGTGKETENETGNIGHTGDTGIVIYNRFLHDTGTGTGTVIDPI
jgi:hypothetical protein